VIAGWWPPSRSASVRRSGFTYACAGRCSATIDWASAQRSPRPARAAPAWPWSPAACTTVRLSSRRSLTDVLPILGLSAAATFLNQYRVPFMLVGIGTNLVGIAVMLRLIRKNEGKSTE